MMFKAAEIAKTKGVDEEGYRLVINEGRNGQQTVAHLHMHLIGGKQLKWPPGWYIIKSNKTADEPDFQYKCDNPGKKINTDRAT